MLGHSVLLGYPVEAHGMDPHPGTVFLFLPWLMEQLVTIPILLDCVPVVHVPMECVEDPPQQEPLQQQQLQQLEQQPQQQQPQQPQLLPALLRGEISAMIQHILIYIHSSAALHTLVLRSKVESLSALEPIFRLVTRAGLVLHNHCQQEHVDLVSIVIPPQAPV